MFFEIKKKQQERENDANEKDARRKMISIRLINSSSTSVSNSNMKKHMITKSVDICGLKLAVSSAVCGKTRRSSRWYRPEAAIAVYRTVR